MKNLTLNLFTVAALAFTPMALADSMTKGQQGSDKTSQKATETGTSTKTSSETNANTTKGTDTNAQNSNSMGNTETNAQSTKAEAAYKEARQRCESGAASDQEACVKRAETARTKAMSDAQTGLTPMKGSDETSSNTTKSSTTGTDSRTGVVK